MNVSAYLFKDGYDALVDDVKLVTESAASEMRRAPGVADAGDRAHLPQQLASVPGAVARVRAGPVAPTARRPANRMPRSATLRTAIVLGPWEHVGAPAADPDWLLRRSFPGGTIVVPSR